MATHIWDSTDGAYNTGFAATKPGANDTSIYPASNNQAVLSEHTDENGVDQDLIWIQEGFSPDIGANGSELFTSADKLIHEGSGALWFKAGDALCDEVIINTQAATSGITNATLIGTDTTDYDKITILRGRVTLGANLSSDLTRLTIGRRTNPLSDAFVTMGAGSVVPTLLQYAGTLNNESAITTAYLTNGTLTQDTATITTVYMTGGTLLYLFGGTIAEVNVYGGLFDPTRSGRQKTITVLNMFGGNYADNALTTYGTINDYRKSA